MGEWVKKLSVFTLAAITAFGVTACGTTTNTTVDTDAVVQELMQKVEFDTKLEQVEESTAKMMFELPEEAQVELYMGNGAYADEIAVITCQDTTAAQTAAQSHLEELKSSFEDYIPEEADKIDSAVILTVGEHVFVCVSDDADAKSVLQSAVK